MILRIMKSSIHLCDKIDTAKLSFSKFKSVGMNSISFPCYDNGPFIFQTPKIKMTSYGIPPLNSYLPGNDNSRSFIKIPIDPNQPECLKLEKMLSDIDMFIVNNKEIFNGIQQNIQYEPTVKNPTPTHSNVDFDGDDMKPKMKTPRMKYCKLNFDMSLTVKPSILTSIFVKNGTDTKKIIVNNIDDIANHLTFGSSFRGIVIVNKLFVATNPSLPPKGGLSLKLISLEITPRDKLQFDPFNIFKLLDENENENENDEDEDDEDDENDNICIEVCI